LDAVLSTVDAWDVPHAAIAVVRPDGVAAVRGAVSQPGRIASVSKLLSAYAIMIGITEEAVGLDDPAGPPRATLRHLLAHAAGYGFDVDAGVIAQPGTRRVYSNRGFEVAAG
jgi:CubicO group peptidase (beta-lactamase class C family)